MTHVAQLCEPDINNSPEVRIFHPDCNIFDQINSQEDKNCPAPPSLHQSIVRKRAFGIFHLVPDKNSLIMQLLLYNI